MTQTVKNTILFAIIALMIIYTGFAQSWNSALLIIAMGLISSIMALGVNLQWGFAGLFNVGVMGFVALGGLAAVLVSMPPTEGAWSTGGFAILGALAPVDVGQGCVVAGGLCLGIETLQGTDALLRFVAATPEALRGDRRGVLVKRPKDGQDLRVDMPAIGPATVQAAAEAGLEGIAIEAGRVLLIDRPALVEACEATGLFLLAEAV